jgi:uncharacterized protein (DUF1330 family)
VTIEPTDAQAQVLGTTPQDEPVIFLNCHKYHERAQYESGYESADLPADVSGKEAYHRYLTVVERDFMTQVGGRFILVGPVEMTLIGTGDWDEVIIGHYPSKTEAFRMQTLPGYQEIAVHRLAGLQNAQTLSFNVSDLEVRPHI